jgi:hypothetical protein
VKSYEATYTTKEHPHDENDYYYDDDDDSDNGNSDVDNHNCGTQQQISIMFFLYFP